MIIPGAFHKNPFDKSLYIFCNKAHNKLKILHFEDTGFWLYYKRIETGTVKWPKDINDLKEINFSFDSKGTHVIYYNKRDLYRSVV